MSIPTIRDKQIAYRCSLYTQLNKRVQHIRGVVDTIMCLFALYKFTFAIWHCDKDNRLYKQASKLVSDLYSAKVLDENQGALGMGAMGQDRLTEGNGSSNDV